MKKEPIVGVVVGVTALALFTVLLSRHLIGETVYAGLVGLTIFGAITVATLPRVQEVNLKDLTLTLQKIEAVKAELLQMYGAIDHLRGPPFALTAESFGVGRGSIDTASVVTYMMGCMTRERERLASIFVQEKSPEKIAEAIMDSSLDMKVFQYKGAGASLGPPTMNAKQKNESS